MSSIGIDLKKHRKSGKLQFHSVRPTVYGLEMHLAKIHKIVENYRPQGVVIDPITNMIGIGGG